MRMLNLIIDLPKSAYTLTDAPTKIERATAGLRAIFHLLLLTIAMVGIGTIWAVNVIGRGLELALDAAEWVLIGADNLMIVAIAAIAGLLLSRMRTVAYVA